jgi:hypothetical protein
MLPVIYQHPKMDYRYVLNTIQYKAVKLEDLMHSFSSLRSLFKQIKTSKNPGAESHWIMGNFRIMAVGNVSLKALKEIIDKALAGEEVSHA